MILLALILLAVTSAACLGLNRTTPTRTLGFMAAGSSLVAALVLLLGIIQQRETSPPPIIWATLDQVTISLNLQASTSIQGFGVVVAGGGALALFTLAVALAPTVRGFGSLFAWALLAIASTLFGMTCSGLLLPFAWSLAVLTGASAVRASGSLTHSDQFSPAVAVGLLACLLLAAGMLMVDPALATTTHPNAVAVGCIVVACLMFVGAAPFHLVHDEYVQVPSALGVLLSGLVLPVLGLGTLIRFAWAVAPIAGSPTLAVFPEWRAPLLLTGGLVMVIGAAGALREHHMRRLLSWQAGSMAGGVLIALGLQGELAALAAPALLVNLALATLAGALSVSVMKYHTGNDDFTQDLPLKQRASRILWLPGVLWVLAATSALGLPPLWGFWGKYWLFDAALSQAPWVVPLILVGSSLSALAYVGPMARFWWPGDQQTGAIQPPEVRVHSAYQTPGSPVLVVLTLVPLVALGVAPALAWNEWLRTVPGVPAALPIPFVLHGGVIAIAFAMLVLAGALWKVPWVRHIPTDEDMTPIVLAPDTLGRSLAPLAWVGHPTSLMQAFWNVLELLNRGVQMALAPFEERYYLTGVIMALLSLILLMALL